MCVAEVGLAVAIVRQSPWAAKASTALMPLELAYWTGFALPFGFVFGLGRILLVRRHPTRVSAGAPQSARRSEELQRDTVRVSEADA